VAESKLKQRCLIGAQRKSNRERKNVRIAEDWNDKPAKLAEKDRDARRSLASLGKNCRDEPQWRVSSLGKVKAGP
jgi:hypothetical protein